MHFQKPKIMGILNVTPDSFSDGGRFDSYELAEVFSDVDLAANESITDDDELLDYLNGTDVESMLLEN